MRAETTPSPHHTRLRVLDLFSGVGGFSLGLERTGGFETVAFCEIDPFCRKVLAKHWPSIPCHEDVTKLRGEDVGPVDAVCGGYPCQPFSHAGKRGGATDDRHLWPEMHRLVDELRPAWVIGENVAGHISMGLDDVLSDLEALGYACRPFVIPALAVDAKHRRLRVWTVAHSGCIGGKASRGQRPASKGEGVEGRDDGAGGSGNASWQVASPSAGEDTGHLADAAWHVEGRPIKRPERERVGAGSQPQPLANSDSIHAQGVEPSGANAEVGGGQIEGPSGPCDAGVGREWLPEPDVGRVAHGVSNRVDRLRALGNAVVPQIPELIGNAILAAETHHTRRQNPGAEAGRATGEPRPGRGALPACVRADQFHPADTAQRSLGRASTPAGNSCGQPQAFYSLPHAPLPPWRVGELPGVSEGVPGLLTCGDEP